LATAWPAGAKAPFTGSGIETSMDVEFSVEVVKKKEWPHSQRRPSIHGGCEFTAGLARVLRARPTDEVGTGSDLLEALQHATIELHHWLDDDFG
jgi:hypothetical protein